MISALIEVRRSGRGSSQVKSSGQKAMLIPRASAARMVASRACRGPRSMARADPGPTASSNAPPSRSQPNGSSASATVIGMRASSDASIAMGYCRKARGRLRRNGSQPSAIQQDEVRCRAGYLALRVRAAAGALRAARVFWTISSLRKR